ncbi:MAG: MobA/MobL family protein [Lachnospiraceae bacterium]|nr:MobA/MobL family protein [Lachnospiraceae bacterium]
MTVKNLSTRAQICGRGAGCHGGHSAVEQASYISRTTMYCEYDGQTYYPKYSEDLVHGEVMLPDNAPEEYKDPAVLWNSVENNEKGSIAQLARTYRVELPNEWSYELAVEVMRDYIKRNFTDKGICVQFAIHDSENKQSGQRNLHCHMLLTMRGIDENGKWMPKQKKVYLTDDNGERIPLIDKKTGLQKVDKQNRKQWKCATIPTNDWNGKENAKIWRKDLADTINAVNEKAGMTDNFWEHRSFKDQGLDIIPQIHLGEKASAMERAGIRTIRGDINRDIISRNMVIEAARAAYEKAKADFEAIKAVPASIVNAVKNEIVELIRKVAERNSNRLKAPIMGTKYYRLISDRKKLQDKAYMEQFVSSRELASFEELEAYKAERESVYGGIVSERDSIRERIDYYEKLLRKYAEYEPYIKYNKELWSLKGLARKRYNNAHLEEITNYTVQRALLKGMIKGEDKTIRAKEWRKELDKLIAEYDKTNVPYMDVVSVLAGCEVLEYNKKELARMLENESHKLNRAKEKNKTI